MLTQKIKKRYIRYGYLKSSYYMDEQKKMSFLWKLNARASKTYKTIHLTQIIIGECYAVSNRGNGRRKFWYGPSVCILHTKKQRTGIYTKKRHNQFNGKILKANTIAIAFDDGCERDNRLTILFFYTHTHAKPKQDHCFVQIQQKSENILYIYIFWKLVQQIIGKLNFLFAIRLTRVSHECFRNLLFSLHRKSFLWCMRYRKISFDSWVLYFLNCSHRFYFVVFFCSGCVLIFGGCNRTNCTWYKGVRRAHHYIVIIIT